MMVGRLLSYWEGNFSGAMLNFGRVCIFLLPVVLAVFPHHHVEPINGLDWNEHWTVTYGNESDEVCRNLSKCLLKKIIVFLISIYCCILEHWKNVVSFGQKPVQSEIRKPSNTKDPWWIKDVFFFSVFPSIRKSWWNIILLVPGLPYRDATHRWTCTLDMWGENHRWLPVLPWIHGFSGKWAPKKWKETTHIGDTPLFFPRIPGKIPMDSWEEGI